MNIFWLIGIAILLMFCLWMALQPKQGSKASNAPQDDKSPSPKLNTASPQSWPSLEAEIQHIVAQGHKILAIKRVREQTGWGHKKAKNYVEALPALNNGSRSKDQEISIVSNFLPNDLPIEKKAEVRRLMMNGQKIAAIKQVRAEMGLGLREAKEYVENLRLPGEVPNNPSDLQPSDTSVEEDFELLEHLRNHRKIAAIKRIRELTGGMSLAEAKARVEEIMRSQR